MTIRRHDLSSRRGFSIVEGAISVVLVGGLLVAALNTVGGATVAQRSTGDRGRGQLLAAALLAEVLQQEYGDPNETAAFGREASESSASRNGFDDVDDYAGWTESPPRAKDGTTIPNMVGWQRTVQVTLVIPTNLAQAAGADLGLKRITVLVAYNGRAVATLTALKCGAAGPSQVLPPEEDPFFEDPILQSQ